jgi:hypothetical protein
MNAVICFWSLFTSRQGKRGQQRELGQVSERSHLIVAYCCTELDSALQHDVRLHPPCIGTLSQRSRKQQSSRLFFTMELRAAA